MGPWTTAEIESARAVPFHVLLHFLGAYCKLDREYRSDQFGREHPCSCELCWP